MKPLFRWCIREWRRGLTGSRILFFCLALGVGAMSAIGSTAAALRQALEGDARAILGGDVAVSLTSRELSPDAVEALSRLGTVSRSAMLRAMLHAGDGSLLVEAKAVDSRYPLYGDFRVYGQGEVRGKDLAPNALVADAEVLARLGISVGDRVRLGAAELSVQGVIEAAPGQPLDIFTLGPRVILSWDALKATGLLAPGSLYQMTYALRLPPGMDAERVAQDLAAVGDPGWRVRPFSKASGRMEVLLERLRTVSAFVALAILLVGGLGVASGVRAHLATRLVEMAIWKTLGAPSWVLVAVHGGHVLLWGGAAIAVGVFAGAMVPWAMRAAGWSIVEPGWYSLPLLTASACGLFTLGLFAALPLGRAVAVPAATVFRSAALGLPPQAPPWAWGAMSLCATALGLLVLGIADRLRLGLWFILGVTVSFMLLMAAAHGVRVIARHGRNLPWASGRLAMANLARPGAPGPRLILVLGLGLGMLGAVRLATLSLTTSLGEEIAQQAPTFFVLDVPLHEEEALRTVAQEAGATMLRLQPVVRGRITRIGGTDVEKMAIPPEVEWAVRSDRLLTSAATLPEGSTLVAGTWWAENAVLPTPQISITADLAQGFQVGVGDTLSFNILGREVDARIASIRHVDWTTLQLQFAVIFAPGLLETAPRSLLGTIHAPAEAAEAVFARVARAFPQVAVVDVRRVIAEAVELLDHVGLGLGLLGGLAVVVGFLVVGASLAADQEERHLEAVVYKICGATRGAVARILAVEFSLAAGVAALLAIVLGSLAAWAVVHGLMRLAFRWALPDAIFLPLVGAGLTVGLALRRTWTVLQLSAWRWLRND